MRKVRLLQTRLAMATNLRRLSTALCVLVAAPNVLAQPVPTEPAPPPEAQPPSTPPPTGEPPPADPAPSAMPPQQVAPPPPADQDSTKFEIYGFAMFDGGYDFGDIGHPDWQDTLRPTKLPAFEHQFGQGGRTFEGVRQSRLGVASSTPTNYGDITAKFEFELFGTGVDAGQTTFRLRHAYGQWRWLRAGQTWSPFMDPDVFPDSIEYWGPNGMVFFRNVHLAFIPIEEKNGTHVQIALERPGASADTGTFEDRTELEDVVARFPLPDLSADVKYAGDWGHVKLAGILRYMRWDDLGGATTTVEGKEYGWGINLSTNIKVAPALLKLQAVYGRGIANYMNDATVDVGAVPSDDPARPIDGKAVPLLGLVAFADLKWNDFYSSSVGWSMVWMDNTEGQAPDAYHIGHYALANILYHPTKTVFFGPELQYGRRENNSDDFAANDFRIQFSAKFNFSHTTGGM
jgi:hypothetical protein